jgi:O-antigen/teichoic acid export membrane protein
MNGVRRALLFATADRYIGLALSFVSVSVVSRLLTPSEIGVSVVGSAIVMIALSLREFGASDFLIQSQEVTRDDVRTAFTVQLGLTVLIASALFASAPWFASFYREAGLAQFLRVISVALVLDAFASPIRSGLRRDMAFGPLAVISVATTAVQAAATAGLAATGFSYMSVAWAWCCAAMTTFGFALYFRADLRIFRPDLSSWRRALAFGGYHGANTMVNRAYETLPQLVLGRILPLEAVGLYNRAILISTLANQLILAGIFPVAFPALATEVREGRDLKEPFFRAFCHITVVYWPTLVLVALLAHPIVAIVLGQQWLGIVPLVQIMAITFSFSFAHVLTYPLLLALGTMRHALIWNLITLPVSGLVLCLASGFGIKAMAASHLLIQPFQMYVELCFIRRHVPFQWGELLAAVRKSAIVTACSGVPPILVIAFHGFRFDLSIAMALIAALLSGSSWAAGLWLTRHPLRFEIYGAASAVARNQVGQRVIGAGLRLLNRAHAAGAD